MGPPEQTSSEALKFRVCKVLERESWGTLHGEVQSIPGDCPGPR